LLSNVATQARASASASAGTDGKQPDELTSPPRSVDNVSLAVPIEVAGPGGETRRRLTEADLVADLVQLHGDPAQLQLAKFGGVIEGVAMHDIVRVVRNAARTPLAALALPGKKGSKELPAAAAAAYLRFREKRNSLTGINMPP
jgi:hypothetical protein